VLVAHGDGPGALAAYRRGDPANTGWQTDVAVSCARLGTLDQGQNREARQRYLLRGREILVRLKSAGRLMANQDWITWFSKQLATLETFDNSGRETRGRLIARIILPRVTCSPQSRALPTQSAGSLPRTRLLILMLTRFPPTCPPRAVEKARFGWPPGQAERPTGLPSPRLAPLAIRPPGGARRPGAGGVDHDLTTPDHARDVRTGGSRPHYADLAVAASSFAFPLRSFVK
jgi:hypothetical protein